MIHEEKALIFQRRIDKLTRHLKALDEYARLINEMCETQDIYNPRAFDALSIQNKAVLDAYLKRFGSVQDFLGGKIWPMMFELVGLPVGAMTEVLYHAVKESILDSLENWIELREIRNELAHDYPEDLEDALQDLQFCVDRHLMIKMYCERTLEFCHKHKVLGL